MAHPLLVGLTGQALEAGRSVTVGGHPYDVTIIPRALQIGLGPGQIEAQAVVFSSRPGRRHRLFGSSFLTGLVVGPRLEVEVSLAAEVVIEGPDAGAGLFDDIDDARPPITAIGKEPLSRV